MNRSFQYRIDRLSKTNLQRAYVFWVPPDRSDDINLWETNQWLHEAGLPARSNPMMFENPKADKMRVEIIEDFAAVMDAASKSGKRIGVQGRCSRVPHIVQDMNAGTHMLPN